MKTLEKLVHHGARQSRSTGWQRWAGFTLATLTDGTSVYVPEGVHTFGYLTDQGVDCADYQKRVALAEKATGYPDKPEAIGGMYQSRDYGYEVPQSLGEWGWSVDFGRWGREVTFKGGNTVFTYPKTF